MIATVLGFRCCPPPGSWLGVRVGRDRRVRVSDLLMFGRAREEGRQSLAERFAHRDRAREALIRELAGVDDQDARRLGY